MSVARFIPSRLRDLLDTYSDLTFNVKAYGAVGDGSTDDTTAILAAIAAAALVGGTVFFPPGQYKITSTLNITSPLTLRGAGMRQDVFGTEFGGLAFSALGSCLLWYGAAGGTMVNICPATGASRALVGVGVEGLALDGRATSPTTGAATGIRLAASQQAIIRNIYARECTKACILTEGNTDATYTGLNDVYSCSFEDIWLYQLTSNGDGLFVGSLYTADPTKTAGGGNTTFCTFRHLHITNKGGSGNCITVADADDCAFYMIGLSNHTSTGKGVLLKGANAQYHGARTCLFSMLWPSYQGLTAEGTESATYPSGPNVVYGWSDQDAVVPAPTVETGALLAVYKMSGDILNYGGVPTSIAESARIDDTRYAYGSSIVQTIHGYKARGTRAAPRRVKADDTLWAESGYGFSAADDSSTATPNATQSARIRFAAGEDHTSTAQGGYIAFDTIADGATSLVNRASIDSQGLNLNGLKARGSAAASGAGDLLRYEQLIGLYLLLTGGTMSGDIAMGTHKVTGLAAATTAGDAVRYEQIPVVLDQHGFATGIRVPDFFQGQTTVVGTANRAYVIRFRCPRDITVSKITFNLIVAATNNDNCDVGILSSDGTTLLRSSGSTAGKLNATPGIQTVNLSSSIALTAGTVYYAAFAYGAVGGTAASISMTNYSTNSSDLMGATMPNLEQAIQESAFPLAAPFTATTATQAPMLGLLA